MIIVDSHVQVVRSFAFLEEWQTTDAVLEAGKPEYTVGRCEGERVVGIHGEKGKGEAELTWKVVLHLGEIEAPIYGATATDALAQAATTVRMNPLLEGLDGDATGR